MTPQEIQAGLARLDRGFMRPSISGPIAIWSIETSHGTETVPADVCDRPEGLDQFLQGTPIEGAEPERIEGKYLAKLSAPGYMDQTETAAFDTFEAAAEYLIEMYDDSDQDDDDQPAGEA